MHIAVMSDIHGWGLALDLVLADLDAQGDVVETIVAGDLCQGGPAPAAVLDTLRTRPLTVLTGNTDRDLVESARSGTASGSTRFTLEQIGEDGVAYLATLGFSRRITPPGGRSRVDDLLAVHANPWDLDRKLHPEMSDRELGEVLGDTKAAVVAFGHVHIAYVRSLGRTVLADVSSVGNPKDRDLRCKYGLFSWDATAGRWDVEVRRLPYPIEETIAQVRGSGLPQPEKAIRTLLKASY